MNTEPATADDIRACFRLLLGRSPGEDEWPGHSLRIGMPVADVVREFLTSLEFRRRDLLAVDSEVETIQINGHPLSVYADDLGVSNILKSGSYEAGVTRVLRERLTPGCTFLDLGANLGYYTVMAAHLVGVGEVIAVEASARNVRALRSSVSANGLSNVTILNLAASSAWSLLAFGLSGTNGITGSLAADDLYTDVVQGARLDDVLADLERLDVIKIDVEGAEYLALAGLAKTIERFRPVIVSEFSPGALEAVSAVSGSQYLAPFFDLGYLVAPIGFDGVLGELTSDAQAILRVYEEAGSDHIDILMQPPPSPLASP